MARRLAPVAAALLAALATARARAEPTRTSQPLKSGTKVERERGRVSALFGGSIRRSGSPATPLSGAVLAVELPLLRALALATDFRLDTGQARTQPARVNIATWSGAAHLLIGQHRGRWRWGAGPGARLGWVRLESDPTASSGLDRRTATGIWAGPGVTVRATHAFLPRQLILSLSVDGGLVVLPVSAALAPGRDLYAMQGGWMGITIAGGLDL
jgi:hypothetical protein